jgi:hypothetical protein
MANTATVFLDRNGAINQLQAVLLRQISGEFEFLLKAKDAIRLLGKAVLGSDKDELWFFIAKKTNQSWI